MCASNSLQGHKLFSLTDVEIITHAISRCLVSFHQQEQLYKTIFNNYIGLAELLGILSQSADTYRKLPWGALALSLHRQLGIAGGEGGGQGIDIVAFEADVGQ